MKPVYGMAMVLALGCMLPARGGEDAAAAAPGLAGNEMRTVFAGSYEVCTTAAYVDVKMDASVQKLAVPDAGDVELPVSVIDKRQHWAGSGSAIPMPQADGQNQQSSRAPESFLQGNDELLEKLQGRMPDDNEVKADALMGDGWLARDLQMLDRLNAAGQAPAEDVGFSFFDTDSDRGLLPSGAGGGDDTFQFMDGFSGDSGGTKPAWDWNASGAMKP
jgi:hypothetical protein